VDHQAFREKWSLEAARLDSLGAQVDAAALITAILADFEWLSQEEAPKSLTLRQAALESGYSPDHLGRLVREGKIPNAGRPRAPRILRRDLPRRPPEDLQQRQPSVKLDATTPGQIARSVVTSKGVTDE